MLWGLTAGQWGSQVHTDTSLKLSPVRPQPRPPHPPSPLYLWEAELASSKYMIWVSLKSLTQPESPESTSHWNSLLFWYPDKIHGCGWVLRLLCFFIGDQRGGEKSLRSHSKVVAGLLTSAYFTFGNRKAKGKNTNSGCCLLRSGQRPNLWAVSFWNKYICMKWFPKRPWKTNFLVSFLCQLKQMRLWIVKIAT